MLKVPEMRWIFERFFIQQTGYCFELTVWQNVWFVAASDLNWMRVRVRVRVRPNTLMYDDACRLLANTWMANEWRLSFELRQSLMMRSTSWFIGWIIGPVWWRSLLMEFRLVGSVAMGHDVIGPKTDVTVSFGSFKRIMERPFSTAQCNPEGFLPLTFLSRHFKRSGLHATVWQYTEIENVNW